MIYLLYITLITWYWSVLNIVFSFLANTAAWPLCGKPLREYFMPEYTISGLVLRVSILMGWPA